MENRQAGFSLPEWLAALAVAAVLLGAAWAPASAWLARQRVQAAAGQAGWLLSAARSEAVRLGLPVYVCPVQIRSDGNPNAYCYWQYRLQGLASWADSDADGFYRRGTDPALRTQPFPAGLEAFYVEAFSAGCGRAGEVLQMPFFLSDGALAWADWDRGVIGERRFSDGPTRWVFAAAGQEAEIWLDAGGSVSERALCGGAER